MPDTGSNAELCDLVHAAQRGDRQALEELFARYLPALRAFVRLRSNGLVRSKESTTDIVQSVCREALMNLAQFEFRDEAGFRNWLFTWAMNKLLNRGKFWRAQRRTPERETTADDAHLAACYSALRSPSEHAVLREDLGRMESAFDKLPDDYRQVLIQARLVGLSHEQIAAEMGRTVEAVKSLLKRALVRLAFELDGER